MRLNKSRLTLLQLLILLSCFKKFFFKLDKGQRHCYNFNKVLRDRDVRGEKAGRREKDGERRIEMERNAHGIKCPMASRKEKFKRNTKPSTTTQLKILIVYV